MAVRAPSLFGRRFLPLARLGGDFIGLLHGTTHLDTRLVFAMDHREAALQLAEQEQERGQSLARMKGCLDEYNELKETLTSLPEKVERPLMVPLGKLASFSGTLKHTNEVLVMLGDGYFAMRSAHQAAACRDLPCASGAAQCSCGIPD